MPGGNWRSSLYAADLLGWLSEKTIGEMLNQLAPADRLMTRGEVAHRFVQVAFNEQQVVGVFQSHVRTISRSVSKALAM